MANNLSVKRHILFAAILTLALAVGIFSCSQPTSSKSITYTVTFDKNHDDSTGWGDASPKTMSVSASAAVGTLPTPPTRTDWNFIGWNTQANGYGVEFTKDTPVTNDITVFAQWETTVDGRLTVELNISGNSDGDSVSVSPAYGTAGETVTISYNVANTAANNRLTFSGTATPITQVDSHENGTRTYAISEADAANKRITINALFEHSDLTLDTIAFENDSNESKTYGDAPFTKAITTIGAGSGAISYSSSTATVATVNSAGLVTIIGAGTTTIKAEKASDGTYEKTEAEYLLTVSQLQLTISDPTVTTTKQYDGNATAAVTVGTLNNKIGSDTVTVTASASYNSANPAQANLITVTYTIAGTSAHNYHKPIDYTIAGTITPAEPLPVPTTYKIDFEDSSGPWTTGYVYGDGTPTVGIVADPGNSEQKSLSIAATGFNQGGTVRIKLPYALKNYKSITLRHRLTSGNVNGAISVYAASNTSTFVRWGFGNPANHSNQSQQFAANLVGSVGVSLTAANDNKWTTYTITLASETEMNSAIKELDGNIYLAIGIHTDATITHLFDDITFTLRDGKENTLPPPPLPPPTTITPVSQGAVETGIYRNLFKEMGKTDAEITAKVDATWNRLFNGTEEQKIYYEVEGDKAYIYDSGNNDVRSEGMSYGMMIAVQLNKQTEFDKLWNWAYTYMYHNPATSNDKDKKGFFAWQCGTSGNKMDQNPAADGEYYFVTALLFAENRWGNGSGTYEYGKHARDILYNMLNRPVIEGQTGNTMFNSTHKMPVFSVMEAGYTDPSYHLPAFYDVWALEVEAKPEYYSIFGGEAGAKANAQFWKDAANASRNFFPTTTNATTGLGPDYAEYNGAARTSSGDHQHFMFDAWRIAMNIGMDYHWWAKDDWQKTFADRIQGFFYSKGVDSYGNQLQLNGEPVSNKTQNHSPGLVACNAVASLAASNERAWEFLEDFWNITMTSGQYRYYDGGLYMLGLLNVTGNFKAYLSSNTIVVPGVPNSTITPTTANFNKNTSSPNNKAISVTMDLKGNTLDNIKNGATNLTSTGGSPNYSVSEAGDTRTVTINLSYLNTLAVGTTTLTFTFSQGNTQTLTITVADSAPVATTLEYNFATDGNPGVTFAPSGGGSAEVTGGALKVTITSGNAVLIIPFVTTAALNTYSSVYIEIRSLDTNMQYKGINIQIPGGSGTFGAGNTNTNIATANGNELSGPNEWKEWTKNISTTSTASGAVSLGININNSATGQYEIRVIRLQ